MKGEKKMNLILDLDETLISAEATDEFNFKKYKNKSQQFKFRSMDGYYIIFERPHLQYFLDFVFEHFNVSIWTAASKDYALFIINKFIQTNKRKIDYIFFSYHCNISKKLKNGTKDLSIIWDLYKIPGYNQKNTFILDDYDEVYNTQKLNCIKAKPFKFVDKHSEDDTFLLELIPKLEKYLIKKVNINKINSES